jgi:hypothetical protein
MRSAVAVPVVSVTLLGAPIVVVFAIACGSSPGLTYGGDSREGGEASVDASANGDASADASGAADSPLEGAQSVDGSGDGAGDGGASGPPPQCCTWIYHGLYAGDAGTTIVTECAKDGGNSPEAVECDLAHGTCAQDDGVNPGQVGPCPICQGIYPLTGCYPDNPDPATDYGIEQSMPENLGVISLLCACPTGTNCGVTDGGELECL